MSASPNAVVPSPSFGDPIPHSDLVRLCRSTGMEVTVNEAHGFVTFVVGTKAYRSPMGDESVVINVVVAQESSLLTIWAPWVYRMSHAVDRTAFVSALAETSFRTNILRYAYDPSDQEEVRASMQMYMFDVCPTARFIREHVLWLARLIDARHPALNMVATLGPRSLPTFRRMLC